MKTIARKTEDVAKTQEKPKFQKVEKRVLPKIEEQNLRYFAINFTLNFKRNGGNTSLLDTLVMEPSVMYPSLSGIREGVLDLYSDILKEVEGEPYVGNVTIMEFKTKEDYESFKQ
jgi:hypothetical protein